MTHSSALREAHYGKLQGPAKQPHPSDKRIAWEVVSAVVLVGVIVGVVI